MSWALIASFLKALPQLVEAFNRLADAFEKYQESRIDKKIDELRGATNDNIKKLLQAKTNEDIQKIIVDINRTFSSKL